MSTSVFVGNIPYTATVEELCAVLSEVGPVERFDLVLDKDTGKSKGFGFCTYRASGVAVSAVRNLNGRLFHDRPLRIDFGAESSSQPRPAQVVVPPPRPENDMAAMLREIRDENQRITEAMQRVDAMMTRVEALLVARHDTEIKK